MKDNTSKLDWFLQIEEKITANKKLIDHNFITADNLFVNTSSLYPVNGYEVLIRDESISKGEILMYSACSIALKPLVYNIDDLDFCKKEIINGDNDKIKYLLQNYNLSSIDQDNIISLAEKYGNFEISNINKLPNQDETSIKSYKMKINLDSLAEEILVLTKDKYNQIQDSAIIQREENLNSILEDLHFNNLEYISNEVYKKIKVFFVDIDISTAEILPDKIKLAVVNRIIEAGSKNLKVSEPKPIESKIKSREIDINI